MECTEEGLQNGSTNAGSWLMHSEGVVDVGVGLSGGWGSRCADKPYF